jgi:ankyrin repeat protein
MHPAVAIHEAYVAGDLEGLKRLLGDPPDFPNCRGPLGLGEIPLEYAIYHSPVPFVRTLLELGADPNYPDHAGYPSLLAALSCDSPSRSRELLRLLLAHGADPGQRGVNDYTPLHYAVTQAKDPGAVRILLDHGADPTLRTRIDEYATPFEEAEILGIEGIDEIVGLLRDAVQGEDR